MYECYVMHFSFPFKSLFSALGFSSRAFNVEKCLPVTALSSALVKKAYSSKCGLSPFQCPPPASSSPRTIWTRKSNLATLVDADSYLKRKRVLDTVNSEIENQPDNKLFAVVHLDKLRATKNVQEQTLFSGSSGFGSFVAGRQHKITVNDLIVVNNLPAELGSQIVLKKVLLVGSEDFTLIGRPLLSEDNVKVVATVIEHTRLKKVVVFKKKRRKNYKRTKGHRQNVTVLRINSLNVAPNIE